MSRVLHKAQKETAVTHFSGLRHSAYHRQADCLHLFFSLSTALLHGPGSHVSHPHNEPFHVAFQNYSYTHGTSLAQIQELRPVATQHRIKASAYRMLTESLSVTQARCLQNMFTTFRNLNTEYFRANKKKLLLYYDIIVCAIVLRIIHYTVGCYA